MNTDKARNVAFAAAPLRVSLCSPCLCVSQNDRDMPLRSRAASSDHRRDRPAKSLYAFGVKSAITGP